MTVTSHDHAIAGTTKGGLKSKYISPRNLPQASICPFFKTMVSIVALPQLIKVRAPSIPAM
jgi:hypothetical protein